VKAIAVGLNDLGIATALGDDEWSATQVLRVLDRI
jgi:hypothetical protein